MRETDRLVGLLREALVQVVARRAGSGVFVAPKLVLTCAHVVGDGCSGGDVAVRWQGRDWPAAVRWSSAPPPGMGGWPYPDLAVLELRPPVPEHPCAWLDDRWPTLGSELVAVAYADEYKVGPSPVAALLTGGGPRPMGDGEFLQLTGGEIGERMSGGPVLSRSTGGVVALVKATRRLETTMGGLAAPIRGLRHAGADLYREVIRAHDSHHAAGNTWTVLADRLTARQPAQVDPAEERALCGLLAALPADDDHAARLRQAAGPLLPDADEPLLDHRDVVSELGVLPPGPDLPLLLSYVVDLVRTGSDPIAGDLRDWVLLNAREPRLGRMALDRLNQTAEPAPPTSVMVRLRPAGSNRRRYQLTVWRYLDAGQVVPATVEPGAVPLNQAWRQLRAVLPDQIAQLARYRGRTMIELFLPRDLLDEDVESWRLWPEDKHSSLGRRYAVVVRDGVRLDDDRVRSAWERRWEGISQHDAASCLELMECGDPRTREQLEAWIEPDDRHAALVFGSTPLSADRRAALDVGLPAGVPVMIWRRSPCDACAGNPGESCAGKEFLTGLRAALAGTTVRQLPHAIWKLRNEADEIGSPEHCGRGIVLLWDDPLRRPPRDRLVLPEESRHHG
jgi:hypothetical protein